MLMIGVIMKKFLLATLILLFSINCYADKEALLKSVKINGKEIACEELKCVGTVTESDVNIEISISEGSTCNHGTSFKEKIEGNTKSILIEVTNDDIKNTYEIEINKREKSSDNSINSLCVNDTVFELEEDRFTYTMRADYNEEDFIIKVGLNDSYAKINDNLNKVIPLDKSNDRLDFTVVAEDGSTQSYHIMVYRNDAPDVSLKSLSIGNSTIELESDVFEYDATVEYSMNDPKISLETTDKKATTSVDCNNLVVGSNKCIILVTNKDISKEYIINVTREENIDKSIVSIYSLSINNIIKELEFYPDVLQYDVFIDSKTNSLNFDVKLKDSTSVYDIVGNNHLADGSVVLIKVSNSIDDIDRTYEFKVNVSDNNTGFSKNTYYIALAVLVFVIFIMIIIQVVINKKEKNKIKKDKSKKTKDKILDKRSNRKEEKDKDKEKNNKVKRIDKKNIDFSDLEEI